MLKHHQFPPPNWGIARDPRVSRPGLDAEPKAGKRKAAAAATAAPAAAEPEVKKAKKPTAAENHVKVRENGWENEGKMRGTYMWKYMGIYGGWENGMTWVSKYHISAICS